MEDLLEYGEIIGIPNTEYQAANNIVTRRMNVIAVIQYLYSNREDTAQAVAAGTGLSIPTVSSIIKKLMETKIVQQARQLRSTGGRRPVSYAFNYSACCAMGIDVFRNNINIVLVDLNAKILAGDSFELAFEDSIDYWVQVKALSDNFREQFQPVESRFLGVSFSLPCVFQRDDPKKAQFTRRLNDDGRAIDLNHMYSLFGEGTLVMNNGRLAGLSATWNRPMNNSALYIMLNKEMAGAVLPVRPSLVLGDRAGEFAHMTMLPGGKLCSCGKRGCFNAYCSAQALLRESGGGLPEFFGSVKAGDPHACQVLDEYLDNLSILINNLRIAFDCDIILGGYVSTYLNCWEDVLREKVDQKNCFLERCDYLSIAEYGKFDSSVGAGIRIIAKFLYELGEDI